MKTNFEKLSKFDVKAVKSAGFIRCFFILNKEEDFIDVIVFGNKEVAFFAKITRTNFETKGWNRFNKSPKFSFKELIMIVFGDNKWMISSSQ